MSGDFNIAHTEKDIFQPPNPKDKNSRIHFLERDNINTFIEDYEHTDTFRHFHPNLFKFTYWSERDNFRPSNKGYRIDYFFIGNEYIDGIIDSMVHDEIEGSDHCPINLLIDLKRLAFIESKHT